MLMYGEGAQGLSESRGLSMDEAEATIKKVLRAMPKIDKANQLVQEFVKQTGFTETISGHVRRLPEACQSSDKRKQSRAIRQAFNSVIQGSGAVCTNTALILVRRVFDKLHIKSKIVITVHDSMVIDLHPDEVLMVPPLVKYIMEHLPLKEFILETKDFPTLKIDKKYMINGHQFRFPLFAEPEFGKTYADGIDYDLDAMKQIGVDEYYQYGMECKLVKDTYNTQLANESDDDKKSKIVETMNNKLDKIHDKYFK